MGRGPSVLQFLGLRSIYAYTLCCRTTKFEAAANASVVYKSHIRTVARECCKDDDASQWRNRKFDPSLLPNPLYRPSPKVAYMIGSWISTHKQTLVTIPQGVSFPRMREFARENVYSASFWVFPTLHIFSQAPEPIFTQIRQTTPFRARMCLFGVRKQKFNI